MVHGITGALTVLGECVIWVGVLHLERWEVQGELGGGKGSLSRDKGGGSGCIGAGSAFRGGGGCLSECGRVAESAVMRVCTAFAVGDSCSVIMVGVVLLCAGVVSGWRVAFCSSSWQSV